MDNQKEIEELKKKNDDLSSKLEEALKKFEDLGRIVAEHTHSGNDGSKYIYQDSVKQKTQQFYSIGNFGLSEFTGVPDSESASIQRGYLIVGTDENLQDGFDNMQLTLENQPSTDGDTNQSFFYGLRAKFFKGDKGSVVVGENTLKQTEFEFKPGALVNHHISIVYNSGITETFTITGNDKNTVTVNGIWTDTQPRGRFQIMMPIYFGAAEYPWRRLYTGDTTDGGIRFGWGSTNQGQNGLLYMSGDNLLWRAPDGSSTTIA